MPTKTKRTKAKKKACPSSPNGAHSPQPNTARPADGAPFIIDFNCAHCSYSGSVRIDPSDIQWD